MVLQNTPVDNITRGVNRPHNLAVRERQIPGRILGLPLVLALGTVQNQSAARIVWHRHRGYELLFLLEGATAYEFEHERSVRLAGGEFLLVPPGVVHRGVQEIRMPSVMCGIIFRPVPQRAWRNTFFTSADLQRLADQLKASPLTVRPFNRELRHVVSRLMEEADAFNSGRRDATTQAGLRALACLAILEATRQLGAPRPAVPAELATAAQAYLRQRFGEPVRMPALARHLGLSRARMFELFKKATGLTPNDYLQRCRVERAKELLATTDGSITDVALETGFSSSQYFSNVFRKYTGTTPTLFAKRCGAS